MIGHAMAKNGTIKGGEGMITAVVRTIILYLLIILGIRLMGKRQIGELEPSELVLSLIIADLAAVPMPVSYTHLRAHET